MKAAGLKCLHSTKRLSSSPGISLSLLQNSFLLQWYIAMVSVAVLSHFSDSCVYPLGLLKAS